MKENVVIDRIEVWGLEENINISLILKDTTQQLTSFTQMVKYNILRFTCLLRIKKNILNTFVFIKLLLTEISEGSCVKMFPVLIIFCFICLRIIRYILYAKRIFRCVSSIHVKDIYKYVKKLHSIFTVLRDTS